MLNEAEEQCLRKTEEQGLSEEEEQCLDEEEEQCLMKQRSSAWVKQKSSAWGHLRPDSRGLGGQDAERRACLRQPLPLHWVTLLLKDTGRHSPFKMKS